MFETFAAVLDWFGIVTIRIHRPNTRMVLMVLKDCDPAHTCITASALAIGRRK